jgi:RND family efflux transporter MFP subunit
MTRETGAGPRGAARGRWFALGLVFTLVLVGLAWRGIAARSRAMSALDAETRELAVASVAVTSPRRGAPAEALVLPGTLQAFVDAPIYARTGGYLKRRLVEMGQHVKAGQLLAEIDAPELEQQLQQARADLASAEANLRLAQVTAERYQDLVKSESVSKQDVDNATGALDARNAAAQSARHNVQRLEQLQAFTRITAPFAGVVTARNTDVGALIDAGASGGASRELFHLAAVDRLRLFVSVPQMQARAARPGLAAELALGEFPGRLFPATLVRTAQSIDQATRTLLVEFEVPNPAGELLPGAYAEVRFKLPTPASTLILPVNTLLFRGEGARVALVRGNHAVLTLITIGRDYGTEVEVLSGLDADAKIIVSPPDSLVDGQEVRVQRQVPNEAPKAGGAR